MRASVFRVAMCVLCAARAYAQAKASEPIKTSVCEITQNMARFDGKLVELRAAIDTGVDDLPSGVSDDRCHGELKFFAPDDARFAQLLKSRGYRKLVRDTKKNPVVQATVTGRYKKFGTHEKPDNRLALESVDNVVAAPQSRVQKR